MAKGKFFSWLKPDNKQKQIKPAVSVASYVVDQWRKMAYVGVGFGVVGIVGMLSAGAWAFQKERMPHYTITPIIQPDGWMVKTYTDNSDEPLDERIVCSVLKTTFFMLRTVSGTPSGTKANLEVATKNFADKASIRARRDLDDQKWYKPLLDRGISREVPPDRMDCYRMANDPNAYTVKWTERLVNQMGVIPNSQVPREISVMTTRIATAPDKLVNWNPWGAMITEYSGVLD